MFKNYLSNCLGVAKIESENDRQTRKKGGRGGEERNREKEEVRRGKRRKEKRWKEEEGGEEERCGEQRRRAEVIRVLIQSKSATHLLYIHIIFFSRIKMKIYKLPRGLNSCYRLEYLYYM